MSSSPEPIYRPEEAAQRLKIGKATLMKHVADGEILVIIIGNGRKRHHIRLAESDIRAFEERRRCQFTPAKARPIFTSSSKSTVLDFEDLRRKRRAGKPSASKRGNGHGSKPA